MRLRRSHVAWGILAIALACVPFADLAIETRDPGRQIAKIFGGFLSPAFASIDNWGGAVLHTVAFALIGVSIGAGAGFFLAPVYKVPAVRTFAVGVRSIHEIFWALLLLNATGLSVQTGIIAIAIPYAGIFAKVFSEFLDEADPRPSHWLSEQAGAFSTFLYARLPLALGNFKTYLLYRYECGLRSSAVLGFIGLPTLGFELDSFFREGHYHEAAALLIAYYIIVATIPLWMKWRLLPAYLVAAIFVLSMIEMPPNQSGLLVRFLTEDIVPQPLRDAHLLQWQTWTHFGSWLTQILSDQALPGLIATLIVAQLALLLTGVLSLLAFPIIMPIFMGKIGGVIGHVVLVVLRTSPEYMLAYIFVHAFGPSMLPAVLALGLHNGAIVAHLTGRQATEMAVALRPDAPRGLNLYSYELLPRLFGSVLSLLLYRWEIIVRESAIIGLVGVVTLGFYIDSAISEFRLDVVVVLLFVTALATLLIDRLSERLRSRIKPHHVKIADASPIAR